MRRSVTACVLYSGHMRNIPRPRASLLAMSQLPNTQLATLVRVHGGDLLRYAQSLLRDGAADPDDVMQEVWIRAQASLPLEGNRLAWLYRVTHNCAVDARRSAARHAPSHALDSVTTRSSMIDDVAAREALRQAFADIASLETRQRTAFVRHAVEGASHEEVAGELSVSRQASRSLVLRARRNLLQRAEARGLPARPCASRSRTPGAKGIARRSWPGFTCRSAPPAVAIAALRAASPPARGSGCRGSSSRSWRPSPSAPPAQRGRSRARRSSSRTAIPRRGRGASAPGPPSLATTSRVPSEGRQRGPTSRFAVRRPTCCSRSIRALGRDIP